MADLSINFAGIKAPNPFWLASAPPTNSGYQIMKAFDAGWGGAVWKTMGVPIINVSSRYGGLNYRDTRMSGFNNIELISDRTLADNLKEIEEVKKYFPHHAVIASLMVESRKEWEQIIRDVENAGKPTLTGTGCQPDHSRQGRCGGLSGRSSTERRPPARTTPFSFPGKDRHAAEAPPVDPTEKSGRRVTPPAA